MRGLTFGARRRQSGFTLLEMLIVMTIIAILMAIAVPIFTTHLRHTREVVLKEDLFHMRNSIDQYAQDKNKAPQALSDLVEAGYLKAIPKDPFTNSSETWQTVQEDVNLTVDQNQPGITDVHSGSTQVSTEGTAYNTW
jgi:general secretion pathway protein G